jgi:hypothetical protein
MMARPMLVKCTKDSAHGLIPSRSDWSITKTSVTHRRQYVKNSDPKGLVMAVSLGHFIETC